MEALILAIQVVVFIILIYLYWRLCSNRDIKFWGKVAEMASLYGVSFLVVLGKLRFSIWVIGIAVIGLIKFSTTKKNEGRNKGLIG